jgi:hypothetical protein
MKAKFPGKCRKCHKRIEVGQEIVEFGQVWLHSACKPMKKPASMTERIRAALSLYERMGAR